MRFACWLVAALLRVRGFAPPLTAAPRVVRRTVTDGLDEEADGVGPGIYGGRVVRDASGAVVIGQQFEDYNPIPGPVYAGGGYGPLAEAVRAGAVDDATLLLDGDPTLADEVLTGAASPLHLCGMTPRAGDAVARLLIARGAEVDARDSWGYTPLQRAATNNCVDAARALVEAGASIGAGSGLDGDGESAEELAKRLRSYDVIFFFRDHLASILASSGSAGDAPAQPGT